MVEQDKTAAYLGLMQFREQLQEGIKASQLIQKTPFENVSRATWAATQEHSKHYEALAEMMMEQMNSTIKLLGNDAVVAHIQAVTSADD